MPLIFLTNLERFFKATLLTRRFRSSALMGSVMIQWKKDQIVFRAWFPIAREVEECKRVSFWKYPPGGFLLKARIGFSDETDAGEFLWNNRSESFRCYWYGILIVKISNLPLLHSCNILSQSFARPKCDVNSTLLPSSLCFSIINKYVFFAFPWAKVQRDWGF